MSQAARPEDDGEGAPSLNPPSTQHAGGDAEGPATEPAGRDERVDRLVEALGEVAVALRARAATAHPGPKANEPTRVRPAASPAPGEPEGERLEGELSKRLDALEREAKKRPALGVHQWIGAAVPLAWPAVACIAFVGLFQPLTAVLEVLPERVRDAEVLTAGGVTLQGRIRATARPALARQVEQLSREAVIVLLRAPTDRQGIWSYTTAERPEDQPDGTGVRARAITYPGPALLAGIRELHRKGLISVGDRDDGSVEEVDRLIAAVNARPGTPHPRTDGTIDHELETPVPVDEIPGVSWALTSEGRAAAAAIVEAVAAELSAEQVEEADDDAASALE